MDNRGDSIYVSFDVLMSNMRLLRKDVNKLLHCCDDLLNIARRQFEISKGHEEDIEEIYKSLAVVMSVLDPSEDEDTEWEEETDNDGQGEV